MLYSLIYFSTCTNLMKPEDLKLLSKQSARFNKENDLTGMLVYVEGRSIKHTEGRFMQILEGSRFMVQRVFSKIKEDRRHHQIVVLKEQSIKRREFRVWNLGFEILDLDKDLRLKEFFQLDSHILKSEEFKATNGPLLFLKSFYKSMFTPPREESDNKKLRGFVQSY
ncbi:BLUF domain-containing protein [Arcticibacter sp.]|uniref:BLUF domain-containing protein n=1 Tax=Arcticibacter sp. TaxID=1872630 RepID=UPI00388E462D